MECAYRILPYRFGQMVVVDDAMKQESLCSLVPAQTDEHRDGSSLVDRPPTRMGTIRESMFDERKDLLVGCASGISGINDECFQQTGCPPYRHVTSD